MILLTFAGIVVIGIALGLAMVGVGGLGKMGIEDIRDGAIIPGICELFGALVVLAISVFFGYAGYLLFDARILKLL